VPVFTPELAVYLGIMTVSFAALALLVVNSGLRTEVILGIGTIYGWFFGRIRGLLRAQVLARQGESSSEAVMDE
jgi:hypothetical protein